MNRILFKIFYFVRVCIKSKNGVHLYVVVFGSLSQGDQMSL
jgi:hypothetical protein